MATGQTLLDTMELLDQELQLQSGEGDVARALVALNRAQDHLEALLVREPRAKGDTIGTLTASDGTETTSFPTGVLRIDRLQRLDSSTNRPISPDLSFLGFVGSHTNTAVADLTGSLTEEGPPAGWWTNGSSIFWQPLPDTNYTIRWYGLQAQSDITATGTFGYLDYVILPLATLACKLMNIGLDDPTEAHDTLAEQIFRPVIEAMTSYVQDRAPGYDYNYLHTE